MITYPIWGGVLSVGLLILVGAIALTPGGIDGTTQMFGERESSNRLRTITGLLLGVGVVLVANGTIRFVFKYFLS
jgi:uncharacterized membrane protein